MSKNVGSNAFQDATPNAQSLGVPVLQLNCLHIAYYCST